MKFNANSYYHYIVRFWRDCSSWKCINRSGGKGTFYTEVLNCLHESVRKKRCERYENWSYLLHHDNILSHISLSFSAVLREHSHCHSSVTIFTWLGPVWLFSFCFQNRKGELISDRFLTIEKGKWNFISFYNTTANPKTWKRHRQQCIVLWC